MVLQIKTKWVRNFFFFLFLLLIASMYLKVLYLISVLKCLQKEELECLKTLQQRSLIDGIGSKVVQLTWAPTLHHLLRKSTLRTRSLYSAHPSGSHPVRRFWLEINVCFFYYEKNCKCVVLRSIHRKPACCVCSTEGSDLWRFPKVVKKRASF